MSLTKLIAVTHGRASDPQACGRPLTVRKATAADPPSVSLVYTCPLHGDLLQPADDGVGYAGAFPFFATDDRPLAPKPGAA